VPTTDIKELRILPPLAIARLGSSPTPMVNYDAVVDDQNPTGYRTIVPAETLIVDRATGEITDSRTPDRVSFRDNNGLIHPVAPFLEVWARFEDDGPLQPLTTAQLADLTLTPANLRWRVQVANHKVFRRTRQAGDKIEADTGPFTDHAVKPLSGHCPNFKAGKTIPLGSVQYIKPTGASSEIRLRFTPAAGKVYGPNGGDPNVVDDVYDASRGTWTTFSEPDNDPGVTIPVGIFAQTPNGVSRGYLDDACDGIVSVELALSPTRTLRAHAHVSVGPPDFAPDSFLVRTVADEIEQMLFGPSVAEELHPDEVIDIVRRALETMQLMNTEFQNRTYGRNAFTPSQASYAHALSRHTQVLSDLQGLKAPAGTPERDTAVGTLQLILALLRQYTQVGDPSAEARRLMPALMRGADGRRLALTRRQRNTLEKASRDFAVQPPTPADTQPQSTEPEQAMVNLIISLRDANAIRHFKFDLGNGKRLSDLFKDPPALLNYLKTAKVRGSIVPAVKDKPLVVPGKPEESAFITLLSTAGHPMQVPFSQTDPGTGKRRIDVVREWIKSLT
jgi:hypothetical protein